MHTLPCNTHNSVLIVTCGLDVSVVRVDAPCVAQRGDEILTRKLEIKVRHSVFMEPHEIILVYLRCFESWGLRMRMPNPTAGGEVKSHNNHNCFYNIETGPPLLTAINSINAVDYNTGSFLCLELLHFRYNGRSKHYFQTSACCMRHIFVALAHKLVGVCCSLSLK